LVYAEDSSEKSLFYDGGSFFSLNERGLKMLFSIDVGIDIYKSIYAKVGTGFTSDFDFYWDVGFYYLFLSRDDNFRPLIIVNYGPNSYVQFRWKYLDGTVGGHFWQFDEGLALGIGFDWLPFLERSLGFNLYCTYAVTNSKNPRFMPEERAIFESIKSDIATHLSVKYYFDL
jgi:hypothetical protein